jgi:hypothetical protein
MVIEQPAGPGDGGPVSDLPGGLAAKVSEEMTIFCEIARGRGALSAYGRRARELGGLRAATA